MAGHSEHYDIIIAGSGFAGSITAMALHNSGFKVCLVEKGTHPRFAIGESSTPIADMILRSLASGYDLPWLSAFSRYGSWQRSHPEIVCGIKRGFSYFKHFPGEPFTADPGHTRELLVAASINDTLSDTNWLRSDFDAFLVTKVKEYGIVYLDNTTITAAKRQDNHWHIKMLRVDQAMTFRSSFFIDATGSGHLSETLFSARSSAQGFLTNSFAVFSHFEDLPCWTNILHQRNIPTTDYPYNADNSALHHVLDEGWIWVLRFNNNRTSWGFALDGDNAVLQDMSATDILDLMRQKYPDVNNILQDAVFAKEPGRMIRSPRLQRRIDKCFGEGWVALPHTAGFVDPLFSTGIAYSLAGIEKLLRIFTGNPGFGRGIYAELEKYERAVFEELKLVDLLVAGCYKTMKHFQLFNIWSMLYFTFTIMYEQRRIKGLPVDYLLEAGSSEVQAIAVASFKELLQLTGQNSISRGDIHAFADKIRERIKPYNTAGLMDPSSGNMYHHTTADF